MKNSRRISALVNETGTRHWEMIVEVTAMSGNRIGQTLAGSLADELIEEVVRGSTPDNCDREGEIERGGNRYRWRIAFQLVDEDIEMERESNWGPLTPSLVPVQWQAQKTSSCQERRVSNQSAR